MILVTLMTVSQTSVGSVIRLVYSQDSEILTIARYCPRTDKIFKAKVRYEDILHFSDAGIMTSKIEIVDEYDKN